MPHRAVIHIDLDAFFTSVELKRHPELKGKPIIVGGTGDPASRGVVSAASYEARKYGVRSGMPLKRAKRLCPEAVFLPVDFESYERESERFMAMLHEYTPLVESFGLDEAFLELEFAEPGKDTLPRALKTAEEIKWRIKKELGLTASAGIAPNKLLAKMASEMKKPDGLFCMKTNDVARIFRDLPVRRLPGVGPRTEARLLRMGIKTIGELADSEPLWLERNLGPTTGKTLHEHSRGIDASPVVPFHEPESVSREVTFEEDTGDIHFIRETLYELTEDVTSRLKERGYRCMAVTIKIRFSDFNTITRSTTLRELTDSMNDIWQATLTLLEETEFPGKVRLVGVKASKLTHRKTD